MTFLEEINELRERLVDLEARVTNTEQIKVTNKHRVQKIKMICAEHYGINPGAVDGPVRLAHVVAARFAAMQVASDLTTVNDLQIEKIFKRKHGLMAHAKKYVKNRCETEPKYRAQYEAFKRKCEEALK